MRPLVLVVQCWGTLALPPAAICPQTVAMLTHGNRGDGQQLVSKEGVSKQLKYPKDWTGDPPRDMRYYAQKVAEKWPDMTWLACML